MHINISVVPCIYKGRPVIANEPIWKNRGGGLHPKIPQRKLMKSDWVVEGRALEAKVPDRVAQLLPRDTFEKIWARAQTIKII
jgi:hypothetical protein